MGGGEMDRAEARYGCPRETRRGQGGRHPPTRSRASEAAYLEAASVRAFDWLEDELSAHGAPERLQARARRAARDEVRHARVIRSFAERAGARVPSLRVKAARARSLEAMAVENAVEGCVNETLGAASRCTKRGAHGSGGSARRCGASPTTRCGTRSSHGRSPDGSRGS